MAGTRYTTFVADEYLYAEDLEGEFNNILVTSDQLIGTPRSANWDMNSYAILMDDDQDSTLSASVDDRLDVKLSGTTLFRFDGTVSTPVCGMEFVAGATGDGVTLTAISGTDTNVDLHLNGAGTGEVKANGMAVNFLIMQVF